jgi:hypothetical protein
MRRNIPNKYILLLCLIAAFGCKSRKKLTGTKPVDTTGVIVTDYPVKPGMSNPVLTPAKPSIDVVKLNKLKEIRTGQVDFNTFSGKAQAKLNVDGNKNDVTLNIRIKKGQQIWISITALLGIEAARVLITPDSIKVLNKLQGTYLKKPFNYIYGYTSKQINYKTIESLIIGNAIPELLNDNGDLRPNNGGYVVTGKLQELAYQLTFGGNLKVTQTFMSNQTAGQSLQVNNSALIQSGSRVIPSQININSSAKQNIIQADLKYTRVDLDQPVEMQFSVPKRYTLIN